MSTPEHLHDLTSDSATDGRSAVALGYALMAVWGVLLGLFLSWVL